MPSQIHNDEAILEEDSANDASDRGASNDTSNEDFSYVLGGKAATAKSSHPTTKIIHRLWQAFIENVNPITKLVHVPSFQLVIERATANIEHIPAGIEAFMFAIYSLAVLSLTEDECKSDLEESRAILLPRYIAATKAALSRANFMSSTSSIVLQAFVLHIICIRDHYEPRAVWSLTGVAIRVAEGMGMRLDGTLLGLSSFETEIRRRIWWQIKLHDFRAAELCGQAKFRDFKLDETTPKRPANVNDSELFPAMLKAPIEDTRPTEMVWVMFRAELASFAATQIARMQKLGKTAAFSSEEYAAMDDLKIKDVFIGELLDLLETKYLRFCDPSDPLQFLTLVAGRASMNIIRLMAHHPRRWVTLDMVPVSEQQLVWCICVQLLEQYEMQQSNPQLRRFAWTVPYFLSWPAVIHVLDTLRVNPLHAEAAKAWRLIDTLYENNSEMILNMKKPIYAAVGSLCLKAYSARTAALTKEQRSLPDPPEYITKLRVQREAARARREAVIARSKMNKSIRRESIRSLPTADSETAWPTRHLSLANEVQFEAQPQQYPVGNTKGVNSAFWLGSDTTQDDFFFGGGGASEMMNLDTDAILAQDYWLDNSNGETVDWAQWDTWLGASDSVRPNVGAGHG